jgi:hypothetical protein
MLQGWEGKDKGWGKALLGRMNEEKSSLVDRLSPIGPLCCRIAGVSGNLSQSRARTYKGKATATAAMDIPSAPAPLSITLSPGQLPLAVTQPFPYVAICDKRASKLLPHSRP